MSNGESIALPLPASSGKASAATANLLGIALLVLELLLGRLSERLGHASITLTLDVYSQVLPDMQKAATDKLENILFRRTGTL